MRTAAKVDANQAEIVTALRGIGAFVQPLHMVGKGCPDLLVGYRGVWYLLEIKDGSLAPSRRQLTPDEAEWHWKADAPVYTVNDAYEAIEAVTE